VLVGVTPTGRRSIAGAGSTCVSGTLAAHRSAVIECTADRDRFLTLFSGKFAGTVRLLQVSRGVPASRLIVPAGVYKGSIG
jgi:hypothetical protein